MKSLLNNYLVPRILSRVGLIQGDEHIPADQPCVLVANHVSYIEPPLLAMVALRKTGKRPFSLTKYSIWKAFRMLGLAGALGMIPVNRKNRSGCLDAAVEKLHTGQLVMIFPEGTRNYEAALLKGKTGAARVAMLSGAAVVPMGYVGPPGKTTLQAAMNFLRYSKSIKIRIGKPLTFPRTPPEQLTHAMLESSTAKIMRAIGDLCGKHYPY